MDSDSARSSAHDSLLSKHWRVLAVFLLVCLVVSVYSFFKLSGSWVDFAVQCVFIFLFLAALADANKPYFVAAHLTVSCFLEVLFYLTLVISTSHKVWFTIAALIIALVDAFSYRLLRKFLNSSK